MFRQKGHETTSGLCSWFGFYWDGRRSFTTLDLFTSHSFIASLSQRDVISVEGEPSEGCPGERRLWTESEVLMVGGLL